MANLGKRCVKKAVLETGFLKTAVEDKPREVGHGQLRQEAMWTSSQDYIVTGLWGCERLNLPQWSAIDEY